MDRFKLVVLAVAFAGMLTAQAPSGVKATRLYSGADGETHAEEINISQLSTAQPELLKGEGVRFATRGAGTSDDWHVTPRRQYLITLKGHVEIEIGGGKIVHSMPGTVLLIDDTTGKGHRAKVTNEGEWHVVFIPLPPAPKN
jgi:quercetin dioxygenase-like cupin family protein